MVRVMGFTVYASRTALAGMLLNHIYFSSISIQLPNKNCLLWVLYSFPWLAALVSTS